MDKIIIIVYGYNPSNSNNANAICLQNILGHMQKKFNIEIITSTNIENSYTEELGNISIHYIPLNTNGNRKRNFKKWDKVVIEYIDKEIDIINISKMLTISFPFNIQEIGLKIKRKYSHLHWVVYELDPYTYNKILSNYSTKFFYRLTKQFIIFKNANKILLTHELYRQYTTNILRGFTSKYIDAGIPIMSIYDSNNEYKQESTNKKRALYIGSFYSNIRNPEYMLEVFSKVVIEEKELKFHLVGPEYNDIPEKYNSLLSNHLILHGRVTKDRVEEFITESDFLINIGNNVMNQLPSKVLEYIGSGKPIISFYTIDDDTSNKYLLKYPNVLLINQNENIETNVNKIINFMRDFDDIKRVPSYELLREYKEETIEAVVRKIITESLI